MQVNPNYLQDDKWEECKVFFDQSCAYCGSKDKLYKDHIIPVLKNGLFLPHNIVPACVKCNSNKKSQNMDKWYRTREYFTEERLDRIYQWISDQYIIFYENNSSLKNVKKSRAVPFRIPEETLKKLDIVVNMLQKRQIYGTVSKNSFVVGAIEQALTEYLKSKEESPMNNKYRGIVTDDLGSLPTKHTRWYDTYLDAHQAAEKLCKRTHGDRGNIDVETENKEESPMKKQIDGTLKFDLLDDGDFVAYEYEILSPNTMRLYGDYILTDGTRQEDKTLHVITDGDIDKDNIFAAGWDEWTIE